MNRSILMLALVAFPGCFTATPTTRTLLMTSASTALTQVTLDPSDETAPAVSPDGKTLLFHTVLPAGSDPTPERPQTLVGVDPKNPAWRVRYTDPRSRARFAAWFPDGQSYVYLSNARGPWSLWRTATAAPNSPAHVLVDGADVAELSTPAVSPDGTLIAFCAQVKGTPTIGLVSANGGAITWGGEGAAPAFSPDGKTLAFTRRVDDVTHVFLVDTAAGGRATQLTQGEFDEFAPAWSPDGRFIAFTSNRGWEDAADGTANGVRNLFAITPDARSFAQLTQGNANVSAPMWAADGWLYFATNVTGNWDIWKLQPVTPPATATTPASKPAE